MTGGQPSVGRRRQPHRRPDLDGPSPLNVLHAANFLLQYPRAQVEELYPLTPWKKEVTDWTHCASGGQLVAGHLEARAIVFKPRDDVSTTSKPFAWRYEGTLAALSYHL